MRPGTSARFTNGSRYRPPWVVGWLVTALVLSPGAAARTVVQNDSIVDFGQAAIQAGFVADERGAAWLTAPCAGEMTAVQILWLSLTGGAGDTLGDRITISEAGAFPAPGSGLRELVGPVLADGFFNEFPVNPPIPWAQDETLVVDFRFLTTPPPIGPSLVTDTDGCQSGKNGVFAIPPSLWLDLCPFGVAGDLAIRAVTTCGEEEIFVDGFEAGDTSAWSSTQSTPQERAGEIPVRRAPEVNGRSWTEPAGLDDRP